MNHIPYCIGFHGCDKSTAKSVLIDGEPMKPSKNQYDWLGEGCYFWENDCDRAYDFVKDKVATPFVIGAVIDLGFCFDLTTQRHIRELKNAYDNTLKLMIEKGNIVLRNKSSKNSINGDLLLRNLDCYVINTYQDFRKNNSLEQYETIRAGFWEGKEIYDTAGFREKNHIQICVRNLDNIIGFFLPKGYSFKQPSF